MMMEKGDDDATADDDDDDDDNDDDDDDDDDHHDDDHNQYQDHQYHHYDHQDHHRGLNIFLFLLITSILFNTHHLQISFVLRRTMINDLLADTECDFHGAEFNHCVPLPN